MAVFRNMEVDIPKSHVTIERQKNGKPALVKYVIAFSKHKNRTMYFDFGHKH